MRILYVTSLSGRRINRFMKSAIVAAKELGYEFEMACNMDNADLDRYREDCEYYGIKVHHIPFRRNPVAFKNFQAKKRLNELMKHGGYDIVHCNTPIGGVLGRICAKKNGIKSVIYQAHGFHFWKGAPLKNWLFYYGVEKRLAKFTDYLLTINKEDYELSKRFRLRQNGEHILVHGVGIDKISKISANEKRGLINSLNIPENATIFISVGELNKNKNQSLVIKALEKINNKSFFYIICGIGDNKVQLEKEILKANLQQRVLLLGFRSDVDQLLQISNLFVFPSLREGLPISLLEAVECGVPCAASRIRGNIDILPNSNLLFNPLSVDELVKILNRVYDKTLLNEEIDKNFQHIKDFEFDNVVAELKNVYLAASGR